MLVYLASYPRSGNSLVQRMIRMNFGYLPSQVKNGFLTPETGWRFMQKTLKGRVKVSDAFPKSFFCPVQVLGQPVRDIVLPLDLSVLTPEFRRELAGDEKIYFLKLHDLPFDSYFEGEKVICAMRHPGAVIWSYFRLLTDLSLPVRGCEAFSAPPFTMENVIGGRVQFGSWAEYSTRWQHAASALGYDFLSVRFEDFSRDQEQTLERLSAFLRLARLPLEIVSFEDYQSRFPAKNLRGSSDGYEQFFSKEQLKLLWEVHGEVALRLGYAAPDFEAGYDHEQILRLNRLVEFSWEQAGAFRRQLKGHASP